MKKRVLTYTLTIVFLAVFSVAFFFIYTDKPALGENTEIIWDGSTVATSFSGGNGTKDNPYLIKNGEELAYFKQLLDGDQAEGYKGLYYELTDDINLGSHDLGGIGGQVPFSGYFDGNGKIISNVSMLGETDPEKDNYYGLFGNIENANIKDFTIDGIKIAPTGSGKIYLGTFAGKINNEEKEANSISNILVNNIDIDLSGLEISEGSSVSSFIGDIGKGYNISNIMLIGEVKSTYEDTYILSKSISSNLKNIVYNIKSESKFQKEEVKEDSKLENIYKCEDNKYYLNDKEISIDSILLELNKDLEDYEWLLIDDKFILNKKVVSGETTSTPSKAPQTKARRSPAINIHASGIAGGTVYVNDIDADMNYYMGLNYTGGGTISTTPTGNSYNLYSTSNLAKIYISYKGEDIDGNYTGYVSLDEQYSTITYYKYYPIVNGYVTIPLIDNPYADRPNNMAFNGWITDYDGAVVSLDMDDYTRYVKIPAPADPTAATSITMYASWTEATSVVASVSGYDLDTDNLKSVGMYPAAIRRKNYDSEIPELYLQYSISSGTSNQGVAYPTGAVGEDGYSLYYDRCRRISRNQPRTCYYYMQVNEAEIDDTSSDYYYLAYNGMTPYTFPSYDGYIMDTFLTEGQNVSGFFKKGVPEGSLAGYYNSNGVLQTGGTCTGTTCDNYYELLQYSETNTFDPETNYSFYYLVTRDTNIAYLTGNINGFNNDKPVTVTGLNNGTDRSNYRVNVSNRSISCAADLRVEYCNLYTGTIQPSASGASNSNYNYIYGNFNNLKIGRGIPIDEGTYQSGGSWWNPTYTDGYYQNAYGVVGGRNNSTGSAASPTKYSFIVESGYYNYISSVSTNNSSATYYVDGTAIYGNDIDRVQNNNDSLGVYYNATTSYGGTISGKNNTTKYMTTTIKSGHFGDDQTDTAGGVYVGGLNGGTISSPTELIFEGGKIFNINGGPLISNSVKTNNIVYINMKGGEADFIFGGAARSETYGNRLINVSGGTVNYGVFGGSNGVGGTNGEGTLDGDTLIYVGGGATVGGATNPATIWGVEPGSVFGAGNGNSSYDTIGSVNNSTVIIGDNANIKKNVFGGGNYGAAGRSSSASTSTTNIRIDGGHIEGSIYGGGNNNGAGYTSVVSTINIEMNNGTVDGSVYGGSCARGIVYGNTNVKIDGGTVKTDVYGGGEGGYSGTGTNNAGTYVARNVNVTIGDTSKSTTPRIEGNVYGGSAFGSVNGTTNDGSATANYKTNVTVNKGTIVNDVFGGGKGGTLNNVTYTPKEYGDITVTINDGSIGRVFGGNNLMGSPSRNDTVYLKGGTIGNAFGGGNNTGQTSTNIYLQGSTITNNLYGGSNENGNITTSNVSVTSGSAQMIFGANNLGGTVTTTNVDISGGTISQNVFGGGNRVGAGTTNVDVTSGTISGAVYGGSNQLGTVNTSNVTINTDGTIPEVYGGNNEGGTTTSTNVSIYGGTVTSVYGGGKQAISGSTNVEVSGGTITDLFGGGNLAKVSETNVEVTGGTLTNIYGGGNRAGVDNDTYVYVQNATINNSVFGGGNKGEVLGNSEVKFKNATSNNSIYAGGNEADVKGNTTITVEGTSVIGTASSTGVSGSVFGSGNSAGTGSTNTSKVATVNIVGGTVYGNVYGGANTSVVNGMTDVNIGTSAVNKAGLTEGNIWIRGTVYGGGESNAAGSPDYDFTAISVTEGINIDINGEGYSENSHQFKLNGSIFGSGNASSSAGDSTIYIKKLGTIDNPNDNLSIQRTTYLTIDESVIHLIGATDITNKYSNAQYSFNLIGKIVDEQHVGGLVLKNNSTLLLDQNANQMVSFTSAVDVNGSQQVATVTIDENTKTVTKNVDNRVYLLAGKNLNIAGDADANDEGKVTGMSFFGIYRNSGGNIDETGIYSPTYSYDDTAPSSDIVIGSSYILGQHHTNHDITLDGFYTNYLEEGKIKTAYIEPTPPNVDYYRWQIGTNAIEYEFTMTASKYLSMGTNSLSLIDFPNGDTTFTVLDFDVSELKEELTMVDESEVPKFARVGSTEANLFGLSMKSESTEWTSFNKTSFLSEDNGSFDGDDTYLTSSDPGAPNMAFFLYHAKNLEMEGDLGTVIINMEASRRKTGAEYEFDVKYVTIKINIEAITHSDGDHYDASITYGKKYSMPITTAVNITPKSQFTEYYSLIANNEMKNIYGINHDYYRTLVTKYIFPVGTTITLIDLSGESPKYYYYEVNSTNYQQKVAQLAADNELSYRLSDFIAMDTTTRSNKYNDSVKNLEYYDEDMQMAYEEFLFIFDFKDANITTAQLDNEVLFELRTDEDRTSVTVLDKRQEDRDMVFNIYTTSNIALSQTVETANTNYYYDSPNTTVYSTQVSYSTSGTSQKVIDTNYEASSMGVNIQLFDSQGTSVSSSMLSGTKININGTDYYVDSDGVFRIKLADKVTNVVRNMRITVDSLLPAGNYTMKYSIIASSDGLHASDLNVPTYTQNIQVISSDNTITVTNDDKTKIFYADTGLNEAGNKINAYQVKYTSTLANANLRLSIYKRKVNTSSDTEYTEIEYSKLFENNLTGTGSTVYPYEVSLPFGVSPYIIPLTVNPNAMSGTYKLVFKLCDNDQVVDTDETYLIVKKPVVSP